MGAIAVTVTLVLLSASSSPSKTAPFTVAVVDAGGRLLPVTRFDGRRWLNTWTLQLERHEPLPVSSIDDIPTRWLGRPVPREWAMFAGAEWHTIRTTGVGRWDRCISPVVLQTTARSPADGAGRFTLAFDAPQSVDTAPPSIVDDTMARVREGLPGFLTAVDSARLRPLGILRVRSRSIWVIEVRTEGSAVVLVADISPAGVRQLALADAGGC